MTGINSYSTTASENVTANTGINWDEGMAPAAVNNSARQNMADTRARWNDAAWFQYGIGSKTVAAVYASGTSFTLAGGDATIYWHAGRRVKAVGSTTGTIYGTVSSSAYATSTTTVTVVWDSGSLSNETLTIYASIIPVVGTPLPSAAIAGTNTNDSAGAGIVGQYTEGLTAVGSAIALTTNTAKSIANISLAAGDWEVASSLGVTGDNGTLVSYITGSMSVTDNTADSTPGRISTNIYNGVAIFPISNPVQFPIGSSRFLLSAPATVYLIGQSGFSGGALSAFGKIKARRPR